MSRRAIVAFGGCLLLASGCRSAAPPIATLEGALAKLGARPAWDERPALSLPRHPAEKFLKDWTIVLDPGHGGDAHLPGYKRGPTGVREAEINWRVAVLLRELLDQAGAHVVLTRDGDADVSLAERARVANEAVRRRDGGVGADLFLSLHHNASPKPETNFTSVWLHGEPGWNEAELDVAAAIAHRLGAHLRTDVGGTSPMMSDLQMYGTGFGVLRETKVPAVLLESSFHSNPQEEQRLRDADYNLREAYAIYEALCEYAYGGRPTQTTPTVSLDGPRLSVETTLDDGLPRGWWGSDRRGPLESTIDVRLDGRPLPIEYDPARRVLRAEGDLPQDKDRLTLEIRHANVFKHHNWPHRYELRLDGGPGVAPLGARRVETTGSSTDRVSAGEGR